MKLRKRREYLRRRRLLHEVKKVWCGLHRLRYLFGYYGLCRAIAAAGFALRRHRSPQRPSSVCGWILSSSFHFFIPFISHCCYLLFFTAHTLIVYFFIPFILFLPFKKKKKNLIQLDDSICWTLLHLVNWKRRKSFFIPYKFEDAFGFKRFFYKIK